MSPLPPALQTLAFLLTAVAAVTDLRSRQVPNWLTGGGLLCGVVLSVALLGWPGARHAFVGAGLALLICLPLYLLRFVGGGDVKLMTALGSVIGSGNWFVVLYVTVVLSGVAAAVLMLWRGRGLQTLRNAGYMLGELLRLRAPHTSRPELSAGHPESLGLPQAAVIFVANLLVLLALRGGAGAR